MEAGKSKLNKGTFYRGSQYQLYIQRRNKWIRLAIAGTLIPIISSLWISTVVDTVGILELLGNGDVVLSLFALTLPMMFDILEEKRQADDYLSNAFLLCILVIVAQILSYFTIRLRVVGEKDATSLSSWLLMKNVSKIKIVHFQNLLGTIVVIIATITVCMVCIGAMEYHSEKMTERMVKKEEADD